MSGIKVGLPGVSEGWIQGLDQINPSVELKTKLQEVSQGYV